jgi:glutaredoxin-like protein NrdH
MSQIPVKVYSLSTCSHCKSVKKLLNDCGIEYDFVNVDELAGEERRIMIDEIKTYNPRCTFPTVLISDKVVVGNKENEIKELLDI